MEKIIIVKFLKGFAPYVLGDVAGLDKEQFEQLKKEGIVKKYTKADKKGGKAEKAFIEPLKGENLKGEKYEKGKIDVVVPTKKKNIKIKKDEAVSSISIVRRVFNQKNGGFAKSCNEGAKMYKNLAEFILFLNDDVELGKNFFRDILKPFDDDNVALVGCKASKMPWGVNGSIMCIRREIFEKIGGFDERYLFMREDGDICENIKRRGYKIAISKAKAKHKGGFSFKTESKIFKDNWDVNFKKYKEKWENDKRIIGAMVVKNEADFILKEVIEDLFKRKLIDEMVIIDDNSSDGTVDLCQKLAKKYPIKIYHFNFSIWENKQCLLRERLINYAISLNPWAIVPIDADEKFDEEMTREDIEKMLGKKDVWLFRIVNFWKSRKMVRIDGKWAYEENIRLFRYQKSESQSFYPKPIHCGSAPKYAYQKLHRELNLSPFFLYHFGYLNKKDIDDKIERYKRADPYGLYKNSEYYKSLKNEGEIIKFNKKKIKQLYPEKHSF